jgi:hypothetical protein
MARLLHGCIAGVHATEHSSQVCQYMCNNLYSNIVILCHIFQAYIMLLCIRGVCNSERFMQICYYTTVTPIVVIAHPIQFPLLCFIHVFIHFCLCSAGNIRNRGDGESVVQCFYRSINSVCFTRMFLPLLYL